MSHYLSNNFTSLSSIRPPTLIPTPLVPSQPVPNITPINFPAPLIPQNSFRFTV